MARWSRQHEGTNQAGEYRNEFQRDRDRILHSPFLRRLSGTTQVVSPQDDSIVHNRLTHSLEVAQVARRLAERLVGKGTRVIIPEVAEAAGLAHDLGHPPFGHLAETTLKELVVAEGNEEGFEGNAQTFRIVTALADNHSTYRGLNLTCATLRALLKYPWLFAHAKEHDEKFGCYKEDAVAFHWAIEADDSQAGRSLEAEIMDYADDVTYALYDLHDFIISGHIPFGMLMSDDVAFERYHGDATASQSLTNIDLTRAREIRDVFGLYADLPKVYEGTGEDSKAMRVFINRLLGRYLSPGQFAGQDAINVRAKGQFTRNEGVDDEIELLKSLTRHFVINHHALGVKQGGHRRIIETLFQAIKEDGKKLVAGKLKGRGCLSPWAFEHISQSGSDDPARRCADVVASFTEDQARHNFRAISGL